MSEDIRYRDHLLTKAQQIAEMVLRKDLEYGASWKKRGGVGAAFVMIRKIDRLEEQLRKHNYDVFSALADRTTGESLEDTIRDLIGYLLLILSEHEVRRHELPAVTTEITSRSVARGTIAMSDESQRLASKTERGYVADRSGSFAEASEKQDRLVPRQYYLCRRCSEHHETGTDCPYPKH